MKIHAGLYDYPRYYDIAYSATTEAEGAFFFQVFEERLPSFKTLLDVGCGGGRVTAELARIGVTCTGIDNNRKMVAYFNRKAAGASLNMKAEQGDMARFRIDGPFDAAMCTGDTIKYIIDPEDLRTHLINVASALKPDGLYAIDTSLIGPPDKRMDASGHWTVVAGDVTVNGSFSVCAVNRASRTERIRHRLRVVDAADEYVLTEEAEFHAFSYGDYRAIIKDSGVFEIECRFGEDYDPRETITPDEKTDDIVILMRKL